MSNRALYNHLKSAADVIVRCPICSERMTFDHYYRQHALERHYLQSRKQCVFCVGLRRWAHGEKTQPYNVKHMVECLKRFLNDARDSTFGRNNETNVTAEAEQTCECKTFVSTPRDMYGRSKDRSNSCFYDSVFEKPDMWQCNGVEFTEASGLGKDVYGIVQRFLTGDLQWFHMMVKHDAFQIFCREMERIQDQFVVLPFWCLCDGLMAGVTRTQHRHMIVACEKDSSFPNIWKEKVRYEPPKKGYAKKCVKIQDPFHLIRTITYVSRQRASCDGKMWVNLKDTQHTSHFHMNRPLHEHSIAFLCTLFPGGVEELLLEQNGNKNVVRWEEAAVSVRDRWGNAKWGVPIRVTGWKFLNCVIPLGTRHEPTEDETPLYLTLYGDKKLYVTEEIGERDECCPFQRIRDELYVLSRKQQNVMNQVNDVKEKVKRAQESQWQGKVAEMKAERDVFQMERDTLKAKENEWKAKENEWKAKENEWKTKEYKLEKLNVELKTERDNLLTENRGLRRI
ncbi:uncharacterized protein NPIL_321511 [Nephila pilipes]|uniref:Uncharacterized protein n=1 Tax=Nephila pilipes TaxID=299642 RepID=A0A8X6QS80_NEPPI|nr:uncharacterized protein NPIL_321511 [Nephila pilipes]